MIRTLTKDEWQVEREAVQSNAREVVWWVQMESDDREAFITFCVENGLTAFAGLRLLLRMGMDNLVNIDGMTRSYLRAVTGRGGKLEGDTDEFPF